MSLDSTEESGFWRDIPSIHNEIFISCADLETAVTSDVSCPCQRDKICFSLKAQVFAVFERQKFRFLFQPNELSAHLAG